MRTNQSRRNASLVIVCLFTCVSAVACEDDKTGDEHNADTAHDADHDKDSHGGSGGATQSTAGSAGRATNGGAGQTAGASAGRAASGSGGTAAGSAGQSGPASAGKGGASGGTGGSTAAQGGMGAAGKSAGAGGAAGKSAGTGGSDHGGTGGGDHGGTGGSAHAGAGGEHGGAGEGDHDHEASVGPETGATCPSNSTLTYANFGKKFMSDYCLRCHSEKVTGSARNKAPADHNFDTLADVDLLAHHIDQKAGSGPKATNTAMPPSDPKPSTEDRKKLSEWIACGVP